MGVADKLDAAEREHTRIRRLLARPALRQLPTAITEFWRAVAEARIKQLTLFADCLAEYLGAARPIASRRGGKSCTWAIRSRIRTSGIGSQPCTKTWDCCGHRRKRETCLAEDYRLTSA